MSALVVGTSSALSLFFGESAALGMSLGGTIAGLDYLGILWLITGIIDPAATKGTRLVLGLAFGAKLLTVAFLLYGTVRIGASGLAMGFGIVLATFGFAFGMMRAQQQIDQGS